VRGRRRSGYNRDLLHQLRHGLEERRGRQRPDRAIGFVTATELSALMPLQDARLPGALLVEITPPSSLRGECATSSRRSKGQASARQ
jgi:hypothetical protein